MRKSIAWLLLFVAWCSAAYAQMGIAASPMKLNFDAQSGGSQNLTVTVSNPSSKILEVGAGLADWQRDEEGKIIYAAANTINASCAGWIKIFPTTNFTLNPGEKKVITVMMTVPPDNDKAVKNCMLFFTQLNPEKGNGTGVSINLAVRLGVQVYYTPPGLNKKNLEIDNFKDTADNGDQKLLLTVKNEGEVETDGKVNFELTNMNNGQKITLPEADVYLLPASKRIVNVALPKDLKKGNYSATALLDYGQNEELKIGELEFKK